MIHRIVAIWGMGCFVFLFCCPSWAGVGDLRQKSLDDFSYGLQGVVESANRLEINNNQQQQLNDHLKAKIEWLDKNISQSEITQDQLQKELDELNVKVKDKSSVIDQVDELFKKYQEDIKRTEQEIALSKIAFSQRQKQQKYLLEILALAREKGVVYLDMQSVLETQEVLKHKVSYGNKRVEELEHEWKDLSFWYGDTKESLPQLNAVNKQIQDQIQGFQGLHVSDQWARNHLEIQNLEREIKGLVFQHDLYKDMLNVLVNQYSSQEPSKEALREERKLQANLGALKKENKLLQEQVQELRRQMVNLDKKKVELERSMGGKNN